MERKIKNGKREYQTFARLQMQIDYSVDEMAEAIETVLNLIETQQKEIERLKCNNEILQGELDRIGVETLKLEAGSSTDDVIAEIEKKDTQIAILEQINKDLQNDFDNFKNDKDINYLDGIHHKQLVERSIGQKIDKPEECWFDIFEVKVIKNEMLYGITINEDFINLKQIADTDPENCITVIAESPLSGAIYRYNNYGTKEWQLIGTMLGYA